MASFNQKPFQYRINPLFRNQIRQHLFASDVFELTNVIDVKPNWIEPVLGLYIPIEYKRFKFEVEADYGAIKSKNSLVVSNRYHYRISNLIDIKLGWNLVRLQYGGTIGNEELESTIRLFGSTAGIGFRF